MASRADLEAGLIAADKAGDTQGVKVLGAELLRLSQQKDYKALSTTDQVDPTEGMTGGEKALAGAGKAFVDMSRGARQIGAQMSDISGGVNTARGPLQTPASDAIQSEIDEAKRLDEPLMRTKAGFGGNVGGNIALTAPAMAVPGANTVLGGAMLGGALGGIQPVASDESRLANAGMGAVGGMTGGVTNKALTKTVNPAVSDEVMQLLKQGVRLTPGQILGGVFKTAEEKATSLPILGDAIAGAQRRSVESLNEAAYQRALAPIGEKFTGKVGREGVTEVQQKLGAAYDRLLPNLTFKADPQFAKDLLNVRSMTQQLPPAQAKQFAKIFQQQLIGKMTPNGLMNGASYKEVESQLLREAKGYSGSADFDQRKLGAAIGELVNSMKATLTRSNPAQAKELSAINEGWANYARIRAAAGMQGAKEGVFTPGQLSSSVRAADKSVAKGDFARGRALMQDLSDTGQKVVGNNYPDSGTAGRLMLNLGALGSYAVNPAIPAALIGSAGLYTKPGVRSMQALLAQRPASAKALAEALKKASPAMATVGATEAQ